MRWVLSLVPLTLLYLSWPALAHDETLCKPICPVLSFSHSNFCSHFLNYLLRSSRRHRSPGTVNPRVAHPSNDHCLFKEFDVTYFKANQSIGFTLSATNLASNLNASANIMFNAYGMTLVNVSA